MEKYVKFTTIEDLGLNLMAPMPETMNIDKIHIIDDDISPEKVIQFMTETSRKKQDDPGPFMVCDLGDIVKKYQNWIQLMPKITPFYAVKSNDSLPILRTLAALGTGFDCASMNEMEKMLSLGVEPGRLILANTVKSPSHISFAAKNGVKKMTFDNEVELYKIAKLYSGSELLLRIACDDPSAQLPLGVKFGCDPIFEAPKLLKIAKKLQLNVIGVSFHVGSGCTNPEIYETAIEYTKKVFLDAKSLGYNMYLLDIGGGFPGEKGTSIEEYSRVINSGIKKHFCDFQNLEIISEPGRFFVMSSCTLAAMIFGKKTIATKDEISGKFKNQNFYYINDGVHGTFSIYNQHNIIKIPQILKNSTKKRKNKIISTIFGPTCDSKDQVLTQIELPDLNVYDWLIFEDVGGYCFRAPRKFNGFPGPKHFYILPKSTYKIFEKKSNFEITSKNFKGLKRRKWC